MVSSGRSIWTERRYTGRSPVMHRGPYRRHLRVSGTLWSCRALHTPPCTNSWPPHRSSPARPFLRSITHCPGRHGNAVDVPNKEHTNSHLSRRRDAHCPTVPLRAQKPKPPPGSRARTTLELSQRSPSLQHHGRGGRMESSCAASRSAAGPGRTSLCRLSSPLPGDSGSRGVLALGLLQR